jgi:alpha-1,3-glucosyltransferase
MRFTVILVDAVFLIPAIVMVGRQFSRHVSHLLVVVLLLKPDVLLIDHGHFQYNSLILGLILLAFLCLLTKRYYLACLLYTVAVHAKQMATYYSLAFLAALLGLAFREHRHKRSRLIV